MDHILIIDDDLEIRELLASYLFAHEYVVTTANNTAEAETLLKTFVYDLIILDIMMPGENGVDYLKRCRSRITSPVIMLTALGDIDDRINGLEGGADDYLAKPFEARELLLRIRKLIFRHGGHNSIRKNEAGMVYFGGFSLDLEKGQLVYLNEAVYLTGTEARLLCNLGRKANKLVKRSSLLNELNDDSEKNNVGFRSIDTQMARLRNKIEQNPKQPQYLKTVRGLGYMLVVDRE